MPTAAKRVCNHPGCGRTCDGNRCEKHLGMSAEKKAKRAAYDKARGSFYDRGYSSRGQWGRLRLMILRRDPLCKLRILCDGTEPSTQVDHIIPRLKGGDDSLENLQGVCASCHSHKTATEDSTFVSNHGKPKHFNAKRRGRDGLLV